MAAAEREMAARLLEQRRMRRTRQFLLRMALFLVLVAAFAFALHRPLVAAFLGNPAVNGVILGILLAGIIYIFRQVMLLDPEVEWIESFRRRLADRDFGAPSGRPPRLLAPMARMLGARRDGRVNLSASSLQTLLDGIASRLDETRETSRYLIGLLIFLGLLGTFYGLLETVRSVGGVIGGLSVGSGDLARAFADLKAGLESPLHGMATAFSSSLFGLAGRLGTIGEHMKTGQLLMLRLAENQMELKPSLTRLATVAENSLGQDDMLRGHLRNIEGYLARLSEEAAEGRVQTVQDLRGEI